MIMFIVMTNFGQLVYMQKPKQLSKLITNGSNKEKTKRIEQFPKNPGIEYKANTVPKNTGIPGFCKNTVPYRTGMKFLIPLGPGPQSPFAPIFLRKKCFERCKTFFLIVPTCFLALLYGQRDLLSDWIFDAKDGEESQLLG